MQMVQLSLSQVHIAELSGFIHLPQLAQRANVLCHDIGPACCASSFFIYCLCVPPQCYESVQLPSRRSTSPQRRFSNTLCCISLFQRHFCDCFQTFIVVPINDSSA